MELLLIRHGECIVDPEHPLFDPMDPPLTERGWRQARYAGARLTVQPVDVLYCGPLLRNLQTAQCLYEATGMRPHLLWMMYEVGYNHVVRTRAFVESAFACVDVDVDAEEYPREPRETREAAYHRAQTFWRYLLARYAETELRVGAVSHGTFNDFFLSNLFGVPAGASTRFITGNCAFHLIKATPSGFEIRTLNDETHIPETERT